MAIDPRFLNGVITKTGIVGTVLAVVLGIAFSRTLAVGVAVGALVSILNLRFVVWAIGKLLDAARGIGGSSLVWSLLLTSKMTILMAIIWFLLSALALDVVGFTIGFSAFLPAILWQLASGPGRRGGSREAGSKEPQRG